MFAILVIDLIVLDMSCG